MLSYKTIPISRINEIKPLWEKLNQIHLDDTIYFTEHYQNFTFEKRAGKWSGMEEDQLLILVAETENHEIIGYCISTIDGIKQGEIDSLFVEPEFRSQQIGRELVLRSLGWLHENECEPIRLAVSFGHEGVIEFYEKLGFFPRMTILEYKPTEHVHATCFK